MEIRDFCKILHIPYKDYITNEEVHNRIQAAICPFADLLTTTEKCKLKWYGHINCSTGLAKTILQDIVPGRRRRGRKWKRFEDNIKEWTGLSFDRSQKAAID